ncbi:MAG: signal recognition particle protein, partial [Rickettsiales bacterium]|nr:signal recognition particle protein [Rickettsiales bacterium]
DVSLPAVKKIMLGVTQKAMGSKIVAGTRPAETITKIVYDELVSILSAPGRNAAPKMIMLAGLQGTGKTTTAGKLALHYKSAGRGVLLAGADIRRPGAREQLRALALQAGVESLPIIDGETVPQVVARIKKSAADLTIVDTAGRLQIDDALMAELADIKAALHPDEVILTADAMAGQESLAVAKAFNGRVGITGIVMTRADADARGGAVLSMLAETGAPVLWVGSGEKMADLERFHADRAASRILGMGDVVSLVEKAQAVVSEKEAEDVVGKMMSGAFDLNVMKWQIEKMQKMGSVGGLLKLIPGIGAVAAQLRDKAGDGAINSQLAILRGMTEAERRSPDIILASRKERIAGGSGVSVREVEALLKRFSQMKSQMAVLGGLMRGGAFPMPPA